jgi:alpha-amylase
MKLSVIVLIFGLAILANGDYTNPHWQNGRSAMVHLFEWRWPDIAAECENFLAPNGYAGVQVSPANEHNIFNDGRSWMERYGPMSYILTTRSGNEAAFANMVQRCNAVGVRIYVDVVFNHMTGSAEIGSAGSRANLATRDYYAVPYTREHFNPVCQIHNWANPIEVRNCELLGLPDLNQGHEWVRTKIVDFLNHLIQLGVAGFRVDAMKHMWPGDLEIIWSRLRNLNTAHGFAANQRPFSVGEVIGGDGSENFHASEYFGLGTVTEFRYGENLSRVFGGQDLLRWLQNFGEGWGFWPSRHALTFIDNHDNQRDGHVLTYKNGRLYKMANAFQMAWPYGVPRIMSSFAFTHRDTGPPNDGSGNIVPPAFNAAGQCTNGWVCEHRWPQIANMVGFRNAVQGTGVNNWWDNQSNQIAFSRGNRGFIAFNGQYGVDLRQTLQTGLPGGTYCDIATGNKVGNACSGTSVLVQANGVADIFLSASVPEGFLAIHANTRL